MDLRPVVIDLDQQGEPQEQPNSETGFDPEAWLSEPVDYVKDTVSENLGLALGGAAGGAALLAAGFWFVKNHL